MITRLRQSSRHLQRLIATALQKCMPLLTVLKNKCLTAIIMTYNNIEHWDSLCCTSASYLPSYKDAQKPTTAKGLSTHAEFKTRGQLYTK